MAGPYAEHSIVMEVETGSEEQCLRFEPDGPPGDRWLHRAAAVDHDLDRKGVIDRYALPPSDEYAVAFVTVPPGESIRIGSVAATGYRSGGGDLVELLDRDTVPDAWVQGSTSLERYLARPD